MTSRGKKILSMLPSCSNQTSLETTILINNIPQDIEGRLVLIVYYYDILVSVYLVLLFTVCLGFSSKIIDFMLASQHFGLRFKEYFMYKGLRV